MPTPLPARPPVPTREIVVRENAHAREIQPASQAPYDLCSDLTEPVPRPLAAPALANFLPDTHHVGHEAPV
ncbi:MAG: hypothetical protein ACREMY_03410, partial [bacterium]